MFYQEQQLEGKTSKKIMSQVQQLYRGQPGSLKETRQHSEAALLAELFTRNGREAIVQTATPPRYGYVREDCLSSVPLAADGPIMQVAAHPGDGPDFFYATYLQMATNTQYHNEFHEIVLTDGERGVSGWNPERTRRVRMEEAYAGAAIVGSTLHFLGYPDGSLSSLAKRVKNHLVAELAELIGHIQPRLLVVHPPKNDHPDHAHSFLLTVAALERNAQAGGRIPTLLVHDAEFGLQQESLWMPDEEDPHIQFYPMHSPGYIVDISSTHERAQLALHKHHTQMYDPVSGQPKAYADLIDTLAQVRGLQIMPEATTQTPQGQGFSHTVIPDVTSEQNILPLRLPLGSVYRRVKKEKQAD